MIHYPRKRSLIPAAGVVVLLVLVFGAPVSADQFVISGHVYEGLSGDTSQPAGSVLLQVWGSNSATVYDSSEPGSFKAQGYTDQNGHYLLIITFFDTVDPATEPFIRFYPVGDRLVGDKFTITAQTNLAVDDEILVQVYSSSFKPTQKSPSGEFRGATGTVKVIEGDSRVNRISFDVDAATFEPDEYIATAEAVTSAVTGTTLFNVLESTPTQAPTALPTTQYTAYASDAFAVGDRYSDWTYYHLELVPPDGYTVVSTDTQYGTTVSEGHIVYYDPLPADVVADFHIIREATPVANFTYHPSDNFEVPATIEFTDLSTNNPTDWQWRFDDGSYSYEQDPTHTFMTSRHYSVQLVASNQFGSSTTSQTIFISSATGNLPVADFTADPYSGTAPLTVRFTDASTGSPVRWEWDFDGDGHADSSESDPEYTYDSAGTYTVSLTVYDQNGGSDTTRKTGLILVKPPECTILFLPCWFVGGFVVVAGGYVVWRALRPRPPGGGGQSGPEKPDREPSGPDKPPGPEGGLDVRGGIEVKDMHCSHGSIELCIEAGVECPGEKGGK